MKGFLGLKGMGRADLEAYLEGARSHRDALDERAEVTQALDGVAVANLFFEPSTRTRLSFDLAAQRLGAKVLTYHPETSSTLKGESLRDTALTVSALGADILVVRHQEAGVPQAVAEWTGAPVINAGDGVNEHPTQALVDALTLFRRFGRLDGLRVGIVGDVAHSRVAGSLGHALPALGAMVTLIAPEEWLPVSSDLPVSTDLDATLGELDVVYLLRVQTERGGMIDDDYVSRFQMDVPRASRLGADAVLMHPGPMNRGVEVSDEVAESPRSLVLEQVRNGVPVRMTVLENVAGSLL
jgi:aspartate carbamoyltransferase catalytic subunit